MGSETSVSVMRTLDLHVNFNVTEHEETEVYNRIRDEKVGVLTEPTRNLRESKKTDSFYHLLRNVSLPFLNHAGAQHSELSAATRSARTGRVQRSRRATDGRRRYPAPRAAPGVTA
ncbi:hypothetical protein EVAR_74272_1 [Eumeta japonica]|uniref:Uncharacterized protein n=1 Tax=Eumeta variegata TaxID=151549 RepID=A0A4C1SFL5_EUMVA|nr:hypothetical protein EVAR_74272_1 [Eumeta japonica]